LGFDFSLIFYDVTTLYFETHKEDEFRLYGFSKDNKINQPQVLIGLVVNEVGFPIYYDIFKGNTFEGKTLLPVILDIKKKYHIEKLTVVADAGMLSSNNLEGLEKEGLNYIVGARVKNLALEEVRSIVTELGKTDKKIIRKEDVIYEYLVNRARKDKVENDKQIEKSKYFLKNPSKAIRKTKFLSNDGKRNFKLNEVIIEKHRLLEGIKGYKTNMPDINNELLIKRYKDLWRIEHAFRIAKSDLETRPIYHRKKNQSNIMFLLSL
jgi:transposase